MFKRHHERRHNVIDIRNENTSQMISMVCNISMV